MYDHRESNHTLLVSDLGTLIICADMHCFWRESDSKTKVKLDISAVWHLEAMKPGHIACFDFTHAPYQFEINSIGKQWRVDLNPVFGMIFHLSRMDVWKTFDLDTAIDTPLDTTLSTSQPNEGQQKHLWFVICLKIGYHKKNMVDLQKSPTKKYTTSGGTYWGISAAPVWFSDYTNGGLGYPQIVHYSPPARWGLLDFIRVVLLLLLLLLLFLLLLLLHHLCLHFHVHFRLANSSPSSWPTSARGHWWTSTAWDLPSSVSTAGPQPGTFRAQWAPLDLNGQIECQKICQIERQIAFQIECQKICQIKCQIECEQVCQIKCQKVCQIKCQNVCQKICQIECQIGCQKICQKMCQIECQIECQKICQIECQKICQ